MRLLSKVDWRLGVWGSVAGIAVGLLMIVEGGLTNGAAPRRNWTLSPQPGQHETGEPGEPGSALVLAAAEAGLTTSDQVSTRGRVRLFIVAAHLANGDVEKAVAIADEMGPGVDRDSALEEIAQKIVPREMTTLPDLVARVDAQGRKEMLGHLRRLILLSDKASSRLLRARLLVRSAIVKRILDKGSPIASLAEGADLDPDKILSRVALMARTVPVDPKEAGTGMTAVVTTLLALLAFLGFVLGQMVQPVLQAIGSVIAYQVSHIIHPALPPRLKGIHDDLTGADHHPSNPQQVGALRESTSMTNGERQNAS
jgi:hypothetical protein